MMDNLAKTNLKRPIKEYAALQTRLTGRRLAAARLAWLVITALIIGLFVVSAASDYAANYRIAVQEFPAALSQAGLSAQFFAVYRTALDLLEVVGFILVGVLIFLRKSDDWMVMLVSIATMTFVALFVPTLIRLAEYRPAFSPLVAFVRATGLATSLIVYYYLLPDGRFVPSWLRWVALAWIALSVVWMFFPSAPFNLVYLTTWFNNIAPSFILFSIAFGSGVFAQINRYRKVSNALQRQQTKWLVFGTTAAFLGFFLYYLPMAIFPELRQSGVSRLMQIIIGVPVLNLFVMAVPVSLGLAVLRYRLWDIDFIINRSLVYVVLSGILAICYFALILILQIVVQNLTGEHEQAAIYVFSTLVIAGLFSPLRGRVQNIIDQRFYRRKYDAIRALASFGVIVRDEVDLNRLNEKLIAVIRETVQPAQISLWLNQPPTTSPTLPATGKMLEESKPLGLDWSDLQKNQVKGQD